MALMLGAFMLHGVTPGPVLLVQKPEMFWGIITSMFIGNLMLLVLNLPLIGLFAKVTRCRRTISSRLSCSRIIGAYGVNNNPADIFIMLGFGIFGYVAEKFGYSLAPLVLAFVLGPLMETSLRQSLILSRGTSAPSSSVRSAPDCSYSERSSWRRCCAAGSRRASRQVSARCDGGWHMDPAALNLTIQVLGHGRFLFVHLDSEQVDPSVSLELLAAGLENMHFVDGAAAEDAARRGRIQHLARNPPWPASAISAMKESRPRTH